MKKLTIMLLAFTVLSFAVFAQDTEAESKGPEVTYGFSGSFEMDVFASNKTDTFTSGDFEEPIAKSNPIGLKATNFVLSPNVGLDWEKMSIDADATYDGFRADDDDWSSVNITTTWKDFYGFELKSEVSADNEGDEGDTVDPDQVDIGGLTHDFSITMDRLESDGIKIWTEYNANTLFGFFNANQIGDFMTDIVDSFNVLGFELDTEYLGAELVYEPGAFDDGASPGPEVQSDFTTAWIEARDMFGMWTMLVNDSDAMELRLADLDSDVTIGREAFGIGEDNNILATVDGDGNTVGTEDGQNVNVKHTMSLTDAMTLTVGSVVPYDDDPFVDWLKGENLNLNLDYMLDGVGTIGVGALVTKDYVAMRDPAAGTVFGTVDYMEGPSEFLADITADDTLDYYTQSGPALWADANLSEMLPGIDLFASLDVQLNKYLDYKATDDDVADGKGVNADDHLVLTTAGYQNVNLGVEAGMNVTEALKVAGAVKLGLGLGLDHEKLYGDKFEDTGNDPTADGTVDIAGSWSAADQLSTVYGVSLLQLNLRADYMLNETFSFYADNGFTMNDGYIYDSTDGDADVKGDAGDFGAASLAGYGYYHKNSLELGAEMTASEASTITVSTAYDMFLGLPGASDFYADGATDDQKAAIDHQYDLWKDENFAPLSVSVAFAFSY